MPYRRKVLIGLGGSIAITGCTGNVIENSASEPINTTFQGEGSSLNEIEIELDGPVFFDIESSSNLEIRIIPEEEESRGSNIRLDSDLSTAKVHRDIEVGNYALDIGSEGSWNIRIEQYPVIEPEGVEKSNYPLTIEDNVWSIFGPYFIEGFHSIEVSSNTLMGIKFIDETGEVIEYIRYDGGGGPFERVQPDPINFESVCWIECGIGGPHWRRPDDVQYNLTIDKAN